MRKLWSLGAAALLVASRVEAQGPIAGAAVGPHGGLDAVVAMPIGEFKDHVGTSWGGAARGAFPVALNGALLVRADVGAVQYGNVGEDVVLSGGSRRVTGRQTTTNNLAFFTVGPEIAARVGVIRPYADLFAGVGYFWTQSELRGSSDSEPFATSVNQDDATFAWGGGVGVAIPLFRVSGTSVGLDVGARYLDFGRPTYVVEGGIQDQPDGSLSIQTVTGRVQLATVHFGVAVGF